MSTAPQETARRVQALGATVRGRVAERIVGLDEVVEQVLIAIITRNHVLLEDVPGLAKTLLLSTTAQLLDLSFSRIQFTPDLMPSDVTGSEFLVQDAFTGERGLTIDLTTGERGKPMAEVARRYKAARLLWVVVGDWNYGEGSSREHAAMSPRYLGCVAVIVRSFARIHETNLKKQGILPLTFVDPADYDKFEQNDRVSITGLYALEPGRPVTLEIKKPDGRVLRIEARHSMTREQIAWFKAGSALNAGQPVDVASGGPADPSNVTLKAGDTKAKPGKDV